VPCQASGASLSRTCGQTAVLLRLVGMRGVAAGDHEGAPRFHWPWTLWLNTVTSLTVGLECAVLIFMASQHLTQTSRSGHVMDFWHPTGKARR
jgi:hypothetical protein